MRGGAAADPGAPLVGVWRATLQDPIGGPATVELVLQRDRTFSQLTTYQAGPIYIRGRYRLPAQGLLRLDFEDAEPKEVCLPGPQGGVDCTPIRHPGGETNSYEMPDLNTRVTRSSLCDQAWCVITSRGAGP